MVIFPNTRSGRMQGRKKKKKKEKIFRDVFPCGFPICGDKKGGKGKYFCFFP